MRCPKCDHEEPDLALECSACGLIFARYRPDGEAPPAPPSRGVPVAEPSALDRAGVRALWLGLALALPLYLFPFSRFVLSYLVILVHELGHAAVAWLFGYPAIPAFDFVYGGGAAVHGERQPLILILVYALFGLLLYGLRERATARLLVAGVVIVYSVAAFTPVHEAVQIFMGHGSELVFAGIFFYRALSGYGCRLAAERPLYAMLAWFIQLSAVQLSYLLMISEEHRRHYGAAKGGGHWMDFSRLARDYLGVDLAVIASLFFVIAVLPLGLSYLYLINRASLRQGLARLLAPESLG